MILEIGKAKPDGSENLGSTPVKSDEVIPGDNPSTTITDAVQKYVDFLRQESQKAAEYTQYLRDIIGNDYSEACD